MKNMKRLTALILSLVMVLALTACGGSGGASGDNPYNLDYTSAELQPMTDERASKDVLLEAKEYYLDGLASSSDDITKQTYKDVAERIGVDASEFQYFESYGQYRYTWYVEGSEGPCLLVVFDTNGKLTSVSASIS